MAVYVSPHQGLRLMGGPRGTVRFEDGWYRAVDEAEDAWMQAHPDFGVRFFLEGEQPQPKPQSEQLQDRIAALEKERDFWRQQAEAAQEEIRRLKAAVERLTEEVRRLRAQRRA